MIPVTLTRHECHLAMMAGGMRSLLSLEDPNSHGLATLPDEAIRRWGIDIEGAGAELAVARRLNKFWNAVVDPESFRGLRGDVGEVQVRSTAHREGCLLLHERDPDDAKFILVIGAMPHYQIAGWTYGREGKVPEFWRTSTGRPAYFLPQWFLEPLGPETPAQRQARLTGERPEREIAA